MVALLLLLLLLLLIPRIPVHFRGACFYYNFNTGESSWEQPLSVYRTSRYDEEWWRNADKKALAARSRVLRESVDDWQYVHDERSGLCFWWNPVSLYVGIALGCTPAGITYVTIFLLFFPNWLVLFVSID